MNFMRIVTSYTSRVSTVSTSVVRIGHCRLFSTSGGFGNGNKKNTTQHSELEDDRLKFPSIDAFAKGKSLLTGMKEMGALAAQQKESVFEKMTFPSQFTLKIIGENTETFKDDILKKLANVVNVDVAQIQYSVKESGGSSRFLSITASPTFENSAQIYAAYAALQEDSRIKFVL